MIRDYDQKDFPALKSIYTAQGFDYPMPNISEPLFMVRKVREVNGRVVGGLFLRLTAETFLLVEGSPMVKARSIRELQPSVVAEAYQKGLSEMICVVPPEISKEFTLPLTKMGWELTREWPMWQRILHA